MRGPVPNHSSDLSRNRDANRGDRPEITKGKAREVGEIPVADPTWHPIAVRLWDALRTSGQSDFYQDSDWAMAYSLCEDLSYYKKAGKRSGQLLAVIYGTFERLLVTEGDRRRVRLELEGESTEDNGLKEYMEDDGPGLTLVA